MTRHVAARMAETNGGESLAVDGVWPDEGTSESRGNGEPQRSCGKPSGAWKRPSTKVWRSSSGCLVEKGSGLTSWTVRMTFGDVIECQPKL